MTGTRAWGSAQRVRRAFRQGAIIVLALLLPVFAHRLWDYVEVRRLVREIETIQNKREPVTENEAASGRQKLPTEEQGAAAYYLAGGLLALGRAPVQVTAPVREWLAETNPNTKALPSLLIPVRQALERSRDALMLVDKGAELPFAGFPAGTDYSYRTASMGLLSELVAARTLSLSQSGEGDTAVSSVISGLQLRRALRETRWVSTSSYQVPAVLSLSRPSLEALSRLQIALEAEVQRDQSLEVLLRERAQSIELLWRRYYGPHPATPLLYGGLQRDATDMLMRPWITHSAVEILRLWETLIDIAKLPWPQKAQRSNEVIQRYQELQENRQSPSNALVNERIVIGAFARAVDATPLVIDRSSLLAVAIERFRRERGSLPSTLNDLIPSYISDVPSDPLSNGRLLFRRAENSYTIYSIGTDQEDDGGDLSSALQRASSRGAGPQIIRGADVGVRVLLQTN